MELKRLQVSARMMTVAQQGILRSVEDKDRLYSKCSCSAYVARGC